MTSRCDQDDSTDLAALPPGATGEVESVDETSPLGRRLADLGFVPRTPVRGQRQKKPQTSPGQPGASLP